MANIIINSQLGYFPNWLRSFTDEATAYISESITWSKDCQAATVSICLDQRKSSFAMTETHSRLMKRSPNVLIDFHVGQRPQVKQVGSIVRPNHELQASSVGRCSGSRRDVWLMIKDSVEHTALVAASVLNQLSSIKFTNKTSSANRRNLVSVKLRFFPRYQKNKKKLTLRKKSQSSNRPYMSHFNVARRTGV